MRADELHGDGALAQQQIRFRLDERGAILRSEAIFALGLGQDIVFDGPFLVMMRYKDSKNPYFAVWVDNPEILVAY